MPLDAATAAAIAAQTAQSIVNTEHLRGNLIPAQPGTLTSIDANLSRIGDALWVLSDVSKSILDTLQNTEVAARSQVTAMNTNNSTNAMLAKSQIDANDLNRAVTEYSLTSSGQPLPKLAPSSVRMKDLAKSSAEMMSIAKVEGLVSQILKDSLDDIVLYGKGTEVYKTLAVKFEEAKKAILAKLLPSIENTKSKAASMLGVKNPPLFE